LIAWAWIALDGEGAVVIRNYAELGSR